MSGQSATTAIVGAGDALHGSSVTYAEVKCLHTADYDRQPCRPHALLDLLVNIYHRWQRFFR